jgi:uncharacterized protein YndB with AHSA1/START domain
MNSEDLKITQSKLIPATQDQIWEFLIDETRMKNWFQAEKFAIDPYEGGEIKIRLTFGAENYVIAGEIGLILPKKKFVFTWLERDQYGETWFNNTSIIIELEEVAAGTQCTFTHDGFKYLSNEIRSDVYARYLEFWGAADILERLQTLVMAA